MFRNVNGFAKFIATAGGAGYMPVAPGTAGTAVAVPIAWALAGLPTWQFAVVTVLVTALAIWAADTADRAWGTHDCQKIVIDEVAGYLVTMLTVDRHSWVALLAGFVIFRILDSTKPWPVRWLERNLPGGWGVVLDDVGAGVQGAILMWLLAHFGVLAAIARLG
jgi:phosphatidylglycerophosphatase A